MLEVKFNKDNTYTIDGKKFHPGNRCFAADNLAGHITILLNGMDICNSNKKIVDIPHNTALGIALANTFMKSGCLMTVPEEFPEMFYLTQFLDEYRKARGIKGDENNEEANNE